MQNLQEIAAGLSGGNLHLKPHALYSMFLLPPLNLCLEWKKL